jgi:hypothetical protein
MGPAVVALAGVVLAAVVAAVVLTTRTPDRMSGVVHGRTTTVCARVAAPNGDDAAAGTPLRPFETVERLLGSLEPGQIGCLREGEYRPRGDVFSLDRGGAERPVTLTSYPGETARFVGIVEVGEGGAGLVLARLEIEGTGGSNTVKIYASDVVVEESLITNLGRGDSCMILGSNSGVGQARRVVVRRNRFHDCGSGAHGNKDHSIYAQNVVGARIVGNIFWNSAAYAIQLYPNAQHTLVAHNVIDGGGTSVRGGILFGGDAAYASENNLVERNVIAYAATANISSSWGSAVGTGNVVRGNCFWAPGKEQLDLSDGGFSAYSNRRADPLFRDRARRDYRLGSESGCREVVGYDAAALAQNSG